MHCQTTYSRNASVHEMNRMKQVVSHWMVVCGVQSIGLGISGSLRELPQSFQFLPSFTELVSQKRHLMCDTRARHRPCIIHSQESNRDTV